MIDLNTKEYTVSELIHMIQNGDIIFSYNSIGFNVMRRYEVIQMIERNKPLENIMVRENTIDPMEHKHLADLLNLIEDFPYHTGIDKYLNRIIYLEYP